ncbi:MAG: right-handed parallel beta-helix repeat-containing protein [Verrucomicrobiota bacterium]
MISKTQLLFVALTANLFGIDQPVEISIAKPGDDLQAILDRGSDLYLEPGKVYPIHQTLRFVQPGQRISTLHPTRLNDYARLVLAAPDIGQLVNGMRLDGVVLEKVILDGNRYGLSYMDRIHGKPELVFFGGQGASRQIVRQCVFLNPRTWSALKVHEGGNEIVVEDNVFFGAGHDVRGNGREGREKPIIQEHQTHYNWGDGISCAARNTTVRNNLIIDPTDVGIVFFGAPGSVAEGNVIASISRESLGGINLVDPLEFYAFEEEPSLIDYRGTTLRDNWIDARGARIHMAIPIGATPWVPSKKGFTLLGGAVQDNLITGGAAAYGIVVSGVRDWTINGNQSKAQYSGIAEGLHRNPPDEPGPFLFEPEFVENTVLQSDFKPAERHLKHLLRCNHLPRNPMGFRDYSYGSSEVQAVVETAFLEMLAREPSIEELLFFSDWLSTTRTNADSLRRVLMGSPEFVLLRGAFNPQDLQLFREKLWMKALSEAVGFVGDESWKTAAEIYTEAWEEISLRSPLQQSPLQ